MAPPVPCGGTNARFAATAHWHPRTNKSGGTSGIIIRAEPSSMRFAFARMFQSRTSPSSQWCAFAPS